LPSYSLLSTTIHAWRYIYPNSVIGPAPSAGGSVTGPPPGLQPGEIPNHPRIPRTKTLQRETGREKDRYPPLQISAPVFLNIFVFYITTGLATMLWHSFIDTSGNDKFNMNVMSMRCLTKVIVYADMQLSIDAWPGAHHHLYENQR